MPYTECFFFRKSEIGLRFILNISVSIFRLGSILSSSTIDEKVFIFNVKFDKVSVLNKYVMFYINCICKRMCTVCICSRITSVK